jgi:hypothetical protein
MSKKELFWTLILLILAVLVVGFSPGEVTL